MSRKLTGAQSECGACRLAFTSVHSFDQHRIGKHGAGRRCMTEAELRAAGFEPNARGFWRQPYADRGKRLTRNAKESAYGHCPGQ